MHDLDWKGKVGRGESEVGWIERGEVTFCEGYEHRPEQGHNAAEGDMGAGPGGNDFVDGGKGSDLANAQVRPSEAYTENEEEGEEGEEAEEADDSFADHPARSNDPPIDDLAIRDYST